MTHGLPPVLHPKFFEMRRVGNVSNVFAQRFGQRLSLVYKLEKMIKSVAHCDDNPHTAEEREAVLTELRAITASPHFCNSKRYPALLRYVVENTLAGRSNLLKERTIGIEVFDRPPTYETTADAVVRFTAAEVRKRLHLYYSDHQSSAGVRISLPAGSYIPEFLHDSEVLSRQPELLDAQTRNTSDPKIRTFPAKAGQIDLQPSDNQADISASGNLAKRSRIWAWTAIAAILLIVMVAGFSLKQRDITSRGALQRFWAPVVGNQQSVLICTGGVVDKQDNFSGVVTADKNSEYPFVSMQIAAALVPISGLIERSGATAKLLSAPTTPLSELREHPVIVLGGYNNRWAMRLLESKPFQFTPEPNESIADRAHPEVQWSRDRAIPYSSADDYGLVARFRDTTTGNWVIVLAGLGRNGTEAAGLFATSPEYMKTLEGQIPGGFANQNIEAVIKVGVIEGKTGAPSILAVRSW